jgi:glycosyltransferase involved in cell wall biosynthesis
MVPVPKPRNQQTPAARGEHRVAYLMSRFPKLTETFVLYEMLAVEATGLPIEIYPLQRERAPVTHPEARRLVDEAHFTPLISFSIVADHLHFLRERPHAYLAALGTLLMRNLGSRRYLLGALAFFPKAVQIARDAQRRGVTHVHAHFASHPAAVAFVIHRLTNIPFSFTAHGSDLHRDRHMLAEKVEEASFVVAISRFNRDVILDECGGTRSESVLVVHCGVDPEFFHPPEVEPGADALRIVCTGTLHEVKGQAHLIEACRLLRSRGVPFSCELVGEGPDRKSLEEQAHRSGLSDSFRFHGALSRSEVAEVLRGAHVVVAPSVPSRDGRREGIPVAILEAASCGRAVVASRLSGIPEAIEHDVEGLLVEPGDTSGLADALELLFGDAALRRRLGQAARERVLKSFDLSTNARTLASLMGGG